MALPQTRKDLVLTIVGISALFSGIALLVHIFSGISLTLTFAVAVTILILVLAGTWYHTVWSERHEALRTLGVGLIAGIVSTIAYDGTKFGLSQFDASPYNPFEAIRTFGILLIGAEAGMSTIYLVGTSFHLLNGISFGMSYCLLFGRRGPLAGIAWGLGLELFQLTLYPGWLDIRFYREFVQISGLSHIVYGAVLGVMCRSLLQRFDPFSIDAAFPGTPA